jgi:hypothetical protein
LWSGEGVGRGWEQRLRKRGKDVPGNAEDSWGYSSGLT